MTAAAFIRDLTAFSMQIALIVLAVAVLVKVIQVPARARYHGLRLALLAALLVPWLLRAPEIPRAAAVAPSASEVRLSPAGTMPVTPSPTGRAVAAAEPRLEIPWLPLLLVVVGVGIAGRGLWLAVGLVRLRRLARTGTVVEEPEYAELQEQLGARATIAQVAGLAQPATFGLRRPVVMLPDALSEAPASTRRAVVIHELLHVRRRDWLFALAEEMVRTVCWFHPAILWLTSQIQLAREEIVDELTVRATGDRRAYVQALLSFADSGGLSPAPAFAHRRQLFHRILSVSKEKVMSRPRIVISTVVLVAGVWSASWFASSLFPIVKARSAEPTLRTIEGTLLDAREAMRITPAVAESQASTPGAAGAEARVVLLDQRTGDVVTPRQVTPENPIPRRTRGVTPTWPAQFTSERFQIAVNTFVTLGRNGDVLNVRRGGCAASEPGPGIERLETACSAFFDAIAAAVRQWRYDRPAQPPLEFNVVVTFRPGSEPEVLQSGAPIAVASSRDFAGPALIPDPLANRPTPDAVLRDQLTEARNRLRELERASRLALERGPSNERMATLHLELARLNDNMARVEERLRGDFANQNVSELEQVKQQAEMAAQRLLYFERQLEVARGQAEPTTSATVSPTPTTPFDGSTQLRSPSGRAPVRVGGAVTAPRVRWSQNGEYTAEAMAARIQGTVQIEALVDEQGRVADARVLRSLPLLDEQALAAAKQWVFTPSLLNGQPVPVLVMIELEFNLRK